LSSDRPEIKYIKSTVSARSIFKAHPMAEVCWTVKSYINTLIVMEKAFFYSYFIIFSKITDINYFTSNFLMTAYNGL